MSLVICSNKDADAQSDRQSSSIYEPWSFRNTLTSTYNIPANAQVALQSCKVNIDGRQLVTESNNRLFQYFGKKLSLDGGTPQYYDTTSYPVLTDLLLNTRNQSSVLELSVEDLANVVQDAVRATTYHPNLKDVPTVEVLRNASGRDFLGYKITYDQTTDKVAGIPADNTFEQWYRNDGDYSDKNGSGLFTYTGGVFTRTAVDTTKFCAGICPALPMHNLTGEFTVNISGTAGRANASGVEWQVGLSRYINNVDENGYYYPPYTNYDDVTNVFEEECFMDFGIGRTDAGELVAFQFGYEIALANGDGLIFQEIEYWTNTSSYFTSKEDLTGKDYTDVKFEVEGEVVKAKIYDNASSAWRTITEYTSGQPKDSFYKPVHQACWCLHPVLAIGADAGVLNCTLEITDFNDIDVLDYDPKVAYKGGWYETMELLGTLQLCEDLESRDIIRASATLSPYTQVQVNGSDGIEYDHVLIFQESKIYPGTAGANAGTTLGFNGGVVDSPSEIGSPNINLKIYKSDNTPSLSNTLSMFVRLNNFGQNTTNARIGNRSKIIAHLTDLETKTGRQTYEPSNLVWLDLDNPAPLTVNEFDISFCYVNEQYSTILVGQSIVALYFRAKPKDLM
jgi:hypothetical protein